MSVDLIAHHVQTTPERIALWANGRWLSYGDLDVRARRLANRLAAQGVKKGDRVAIIALNHVAHIDLLLAASRLGFIFTPFNYRLAQAEQKGLAEYIQPTFAFVDAQNQSLAEVLGCPWQRLAEYENWLACADAAPLPDAGLAPEDTQMILFTGGSTGLPKGAMLPYRQILANALNTIEGWGLTAQDCAIQATPCFHAALNVFTTPLLHLGGRVVLMPQFSAVDYLDLATRYGATVMFMVPTMYQLLAEHPNFVGADLKHVRWAISGGAACPPPVAQAYAQRGICFRQGYGMTEAGVNCFMISLDDAAAHPGAVGRPLPNTQAIIRRADGTPCDVDEVGELTLSGPHLCKGYYERPEETAKTFRNGWLWTGDLASRSASGLCTIRGRSKEMFISGGENVFPLEVEAALSQCTGVAECAVLAVPDTKWGEVGLAAVALQAQVQPDPARLRAQLKMRLASYKVPHKFFFLPALPKSGTGKILKPEIRRLYESSQGLLPSSNG